MNAHQSHLPALPVADEGAIHAFLGDVLATDIHLADIPEALRTAQRWLLWKAIPQADSTKKPRKVPHYTSGQNRCGKLDTDADLARLTTFEQAVAALGSGGYAGLGFALGPDGTGSHWQGIDLDNVADHPGLQSIADGLPGYTEISPSGRGVHAIGYGRPFTSMGSNSTGIEAYAGGRFFTVTGEGAGVSEPTCLADYVEQTLAPLHGRKSTPPLPSVATPSIGPSLSGAVIADLRSALFYMKSDDRELWVRMGLALKELGGTGRGLWLEWSATCEEVVYDPVDAARVWKSFNPLRTGYRAVFAEAQRKGWVNPAARVETILPWGRTLTGEAVGAAPAFSDEALALAFAEQHRDKMRFCSVWGRWLNWTDGCWRPDDTLSAVDLVRKLCRATANSCTLENRAAALASLKTVTAVERLARADRKLAATTDQWDADIWALNTPGGVVDLRTGQKRPHSPTDFMTKITATTPGGDCPIWLTFLDRITGGDAELQSFMQRMLGYALTGDTSAHALFFCFGTGANGKSVLIDTVAGILGGYHKTAPIETFTASNGDRHPTDLAMLRGARLVTATETEEGRRWAEAKIKVLTGGDTVSARFMRQDFFEYRPQFKLLIAGNHKPGLRSVDEAIRRRFNLIPFAVTIPAAERDEGLTDKLRAEWPGILAWMIKGCLAWQRGGLTAPAAVNDATTSYLEAEDTMAAWISDCCDWQPSYWQSSADLFTSWNSWAVGSGEYAGSQKRFSQALEARGIRPAPTAKARGFVGLKVREPVPLFGAGPQAGGQP